MPEPLAPPDQRWNDIAEQITFDTPYTSIWQPGPRSGHFFVDGRLNLSVNCLDRHLADRGDQVALHWEGEPGDRRSLTYAELHEQVLAMTRGLRSLGVGPGDRVGLHLGWLPETVVAMLACTRVGAIHALLPVPLPTEALAYRLAGMQLKVLFTQDGAWRHGTVLPLKARADEALTATKSVQHTIVVRRTGVDVPWYEGDRWYHDLVAATRPGAAPIGDDDPTSLPSDHPACMIPHATRGNHPLLILHGTANLLAGAIAVHHQLSSGGPFWCASNIAWTATQIHGVYGPLACGGTAVMYEGTLDVPTRQRAWEIIRRYGVETVLTRPSVVRTVRDWARSMTEVPPIPTLRRIVTAGEPIEQELHDWLVNALGGGSLEVGDGWGQLELGGIVRISGLAPSIAEARLPDCGLDIVDASGAPVGDGETGEVVLRFAWPPTMVDAEGDGASVSDMHWTRHPGLYASGDIAIRQPLEYAHERGQALQAGDASRIVSFLGRTDDLISISGQPVSLREVQEVLGEHPYISIAEVVVRKDRRLGRALVAAVCLRKEDVPVPDFERVAVELFDAVRETMGGPARPRTILFVDRFGDELNRAERAEAFALLAANERCETRLITWQQVLAAAGHRP